MINEIVLEKLQDGYKAPDTGQTVEVYAYHASDVAGSAPNGTKIGDATEITGVGIYTIDLSRGRKVSIVVGGVCKAGAIGIELQGDLVRESAVDPDSTTFFEPF